MEQIINYRKFYDNIFVNNISEWQHFTDLSDNDYQFIMVNNREKLDLITVAVYSWDYTDSFRCFNSKLRCRIRQCK